MVPKDTLKEMHFNVLSNTFLLNAFSQWYVLSVCTLLLKANFREKYSLLYNWYTRKENVFRNCYAIIRIVFTSE